MSAHVVPTSGICESRMLLRTTPPLGIDPAGIEPAGETPSPIEPAGIEPAGIEPAGMEPAGIEPAGMDPAGMEPAGIEPAGADWTSGVSDESRETGIPENGASLIPAGTVDSSEVIVTALAAAFVTLTVTFWTARSEASATAPRRK